MPKVNEDRQLTGFTFIIVTDVFDEIRGAVLKSHIPTKDLQGKKIGGLEMLTVAGPWIRCHVSALRIRNPDNVLRKFQKIVNPMFAFERSDSRQVGLTQLIRHWLIPAKKTGQHSLKVRITPTCATLFSEHSEHFKDKIKDTRNLMETLYKRVAKEKAVIRADIREDGSLFFSVGDAFLEVQKTQGDINKGYCLRATSSSAKILTLLTGITDLAWKLRDVLLHKRTFER